MSLAAFMTAQKELPWQDKAVRASVVAITGAALACVGAAIAMAVLQGLLLGVLGIGAFQLSQQRQHLANLLSESLRMGFVTIRTPPAPPQSGGGAPELPSTTQTPATKAPSGGQGQPSRTLALPPASSASHGKRNQVAADLKAFGDAMGAVRNRPVESPAKVSPPGSGRVAKALNGGAALALLSGVATDQEDPAWTENTPGGNLAAPPAELLPPRAMELRRSVQRLLNRVCPENVGKIVEQLADIKLADTNELGFVIKTLFQRALLDPHYCETYADLAFGLYTVSQVPTNASNMPFSGLLVTVCRAEFEALRTSFKETLELEGTEPEETEFELKKTKDKMLAMMNLLGNLFLRGLVYTSSIAAVLTDLLAAKQAAPQPAENEVECACALLKSSGATLQADPASEEVIAATFQRLGELRKAKAAQSENGKEMYSKRLQFVIQDLMDLRDAGWVQKVFKSAAKTKDEIRCDAANEEELKHHGEDGVQRIVAGLRPQVIAGTKVDWGDAEAASALQAGVSMPAQLLAKETVKPQERSITVVQLPWGWAGKIIGPRGETARTMQEDTGARIWVDRAASQARITGTLEAVAAAEVAIKALLPAAGSSDCRQPSCDEETSAGSTGSSTESEPLWDRPRHRSERGRPEHLCGKSSRRRSEK